VLLAGFNLDSAPVSAALCFGLTPTITGSGVITGTPGDDVIEGIRRHKPGLVIVEALQDSQVILFDTGASAARARPSQAGGASAPSPLSLAEYEHIAHDLRRQAMAEAVTRLVRAVGRLFAPPTTPPQSMSRPGRQALAWQPQR